MTALECHDLPQETFEYHGILKAWQLGQRYPTSTDIVLYFHSKGLTRETTRSTTTTPIQPPSLRIWNKSWKPFLCSQVSQRPVLNAAARAGYGTIFGMPGGRSCKGSRSRL